MNAKEFYKRKRQEFLDELGEALSLCFYYNNPISDLQIPFQVFGENMACLRDFLVNLMALYVFEQTKNETDLEPFFEFLEKYCEKHLEQFGEEFSVLE